MKGFSSKHTALKVDVIGVENALFVGASVQLSGWGSEGVKNRISMALRIHIPLISVSDGQYLLNVSVPWTMC